jgi:hypothetical protein
MWTEIPTAEDIIKELFTIENEAAFQQVALQVFQYQFQHNDLYRRYAELLGASPNTVNELTGIPFLPISFFKTHSVQTTNFTPSLVFESSGTTGSQTSRHLVKEPSLYETSFRKGFERFYGPIEEYCFLALLPSYLERGSSSLVYMVKGLMDISKHPQNGFYLYDFAGLAATLTDLERRGQKTMLFGVTYALLDFAEAHPIPLTNTIIMETGGMKGRKKELVRSEVHQALKDAFGLSTIHSEYGMTELLSQAYATEGGRFFAPPWMKVLVREEDDPKALTGPISKPKTGAISIIDLANLYSCSFIATEDLGTLHPDGSFEVLGRMDNSDVRGCSLLAV